MEVGDGARVVVGLGLGDRVGDAVGDGLGRSVGGRSVGVEVSVGVVWRSRSLAAESGKAVALERTNDSVAASPILETSACSCAARNPVASSASTTRLAAASPVRICLTLSKRRARPAGCLGPFCHLELMLPCDDARWGGLISLTGNAFDESLCFGFVNW